MAGAKVIQSEAETVIAKHLADPHHDVLFEHFGFQNFKNNPVPVEVVFRQLGEHEENFSFQSIYGWEFRDIYVDEEGLAFWLVLVVTVENSLQSRLRLCWGN